LKCRDTHVKCDYSFPCTRCLRLGLRCEIPPQVKRGRPRLDKNKPPQAVTDASKQQRIDAEQQRIDADDALLLVEPHGMIDPYGVVKPHDIVNPPVKFTNDVAHAPISSTSPTPVRPVSFAAPTPLLKEESNGSSTTTQSPHSPHSRSHCKPSWLDGYQYADLSVGSPAGATNLRPSWSDANRGFSSPRSPSRDSHRGNSPEDGKSSSWCSTASSRGYTSPSQTVDVSIAPTRGYSPLPGGFTPSPPTHPDVD